jgi:hypothetical protein
MDTKGRQGCTTGGKEANFKARFKARCQWLTPVFLATWEAQNRGLWLETSAGK